jgi:hypothetical protein
MTNIIKLDSAVLNEIPRVLRAIADEIENNSYGKVTAGVLVLETENNKLEIFGMGAANNHRAISLMAGSQQILIQRLYGVSAEID